MYCFLSCHILSQSQIFVLARTHVRRRHSSILTHAHQTRSPILCMHVMLRTCVSLSLSLFVVSFIHIARVSLSLSLSLAIVLDRSWDGSSRGGVITRTTCQSSVACEAQPVRVNLGINLSNENTRTSWKTHRVCTHTRVARGCSRRGAAGESSSRGSQFE